MSTVNLFRYDAIRLEGVKRSFLSDCWKAFVISGCYGMGDPLAPSVSEGNREGGGITPP